MALFHPLKNAWKRVVDEWRIESNMKRLRKENFSPLLKKAVDSIDTINIIKNGFKACGLSPFSAENVNFKTVNQEKDCERNYIASK